MAIASPFGTGIFLSRLSSFFATNRTSENYHFHIHSSAVDPPLYGGGGEPTS